MAPHIALRATRVLHKLESVRLALTAGDTERALTLLGEAHEALDTIAREA